MCAYAACKEICTTAPIGSPQRGFSKCEDKGIDPGAYFRKYKSRSLYRAGYKRCAGCQLYFDTTEMYCQCCGRKFRLKPRGYNRYKGYKNKGTYWAWKRERTRID